MRDKIFKIIGFVVLLLFNGSHLKAASIAEKTDNGFLGLGTMSPAEQMTLILGFAVFVVILAALWVMDRSVKVIARELRKDYLKAQGIDLEELEAKEAAIEAAKPTFWERLNDQLTDAVPIEEEKEILFAHSYDGIRELDNKLPPWWVGLFYGTIVFAFAYTAHYHFLGTGDLQKAEYQAAMAEAAEQKKAYLAKMADLVDENSVTLLTDKSALSKGATIYTANCVACHGVYGEGGVGPNFADQYWIHGGDIKSIFKTIKYGVPAKGMISWQAQLKPAEMQAVASYLYQFEGTNPPNGKAPQGEIFIREGAGSASDSTKVEAVDSTLQTQLIK